MKGNDDFGLVLGVFLMACACYLLMIGAIVAVIVGVLKLLGVL